MTPVLLRPFEDRDYPGIVAVGNAVYTDYPWSVEEARHEHPRHMKLHTVAYARARGIREIRTWNDTLNAPMLAINTKPGFVRQPAWITYEKRLETAEGGPA